MRILTPLRATLALAVALSALTAPASAQLYVSLGAPPLLPTYTQPDVPAPGMIWMPGYWANGPNGYYWVPGTWVYPPSPGLNWTPGYWGAASSGYSWNQGYWAPQVGYYGGVNYGAGYYGNGYVGGQWQGPTYMYNTAVTAVNPAVVRTVYVNRTVVVHTINRVSYNGGRFGLRVRPTPAQLAVLRTRRVMLTPAQRLHIAEAARDRNLLWKVNHGRPVTVVVRRPITPANRPPHFEAITKTNVRVVHPVVVHPAAVHAAAVHPVAHPAPMHPAPHPAAVHPAAVHPAPAHPAPKPANQNQNHNAQGQNHNGQGQDNKKPPK